MEAVYTQNCGTYTIELSPPLTFLTILKTGANKTPISNVSYFDQLELNSTSMADVGKYTMTMTVKQVAANGDGFTTPFVGVMPQITYTFDVVVKPCDTTLSVTTPLSTLEYTIGSPGLTSSKYVFQQAPNGGYGMIFSVANLPGHATHSQADQTVTVPLTNDLSLTGDTTVTVTATI